MNLVNSWVLEVLSEPEFKYNFYFVKVKAIAEGSEFQTDIMVETLEQALSIKKDYKFLS
jgi:hypothetical protein